VWSRLIRRIDARFPGLHLARYRRELPALGVSLAFHLAILAALAAIGIAAQVDLKREITSQVVDTEIPPFDKAEIQDIDQSLTVIPNPAGSTAPALSALPLAGASPVALPTSASDSESARMAVNVNITRPGEVVTPSAPELGQTVAIKGSGAEHVGDVEGAVDRIAQELLNQLARGKTLVVWAFDASGSLVAEREKLAQHIEQVYSHIAALDKDQVAQGDALMTMVVAFGKDHKPMLPEPTNDSSAIVAAIRDVPLDTTGIESTFSTVGWAATKWGRYKDPGGQKYQTLVIVVTDEVGEDENLLEEAISTASKAKVPVYVLGSPALFGRSEGRMDYTDPKTKKTYRNLPVRQGPESVVPETVSIPFWYGGDQYGNLDAGFGPYALSRLAGATNGIYFITRLGPSRVTFDPNRMREYRPDWVSEREYAKGFQADPIRAAVIQAARITQQSLPGQPSLNFPAADSPEFKEQMLANQDQVARIAYTIDEALVPITAVVKQRDREPSRRWRAHYDLARGRLLAMKIRCHEYNTACAKMKKDAPKFKDARSNTWRLAPTEEILSGPKVAEVAKEAQALLKRVVEDHPNTPWSLLAQRELKDAFGFKWVEAYVKPPPKRTEAEEVAAKKKAAMKKDAKPEEVPKI